jgi:ribosomal protein L16/L10AE
MTTTNHQVGRQVTIKAGTRVTSLGRTLTRKSDSTVTIRAIEKARNGKTRILWKSMGYTASALV